MRVPSRNMPKRIEHRGTQLGLLVVVSFLALPGLIWWPLAAALPALIVVVTLAEEYRCRGIAKARAGESICQFARSFDRRNIDPWVLRAVYEELSSNFPIRKFDSLEKDLRIDSNDLDDTFGTIAQRAGRNLANSEDNPWFGRVESVADLVYALQHQPRLSPN